MKIKVLFLAVLGLAFGVGAATVTQNEAALVGRAWAVRKGRLGVPLGAAVERTDRHVAANGDAFYSVKLQGAGTVFVSGDTADAPIVAFTGSEESFEEIDPKSPLWALLNRDREVRAAARSAVASAAASGPLPALGAATAADDGAAAAAEENAAEWAALLEEAKALPAPPFVSLGAYEPYSYEEIGDVRVAPLLKTKWGQSTYLFQKGAEIITNVCMNYYTPNGPDPEAFTPGAASNAVCGCVATAMAQVMYYNRFPTAELEPFTRECRWNDTNKLALVTQGGTFDWDSMLPDPGTEPNASKKSLAAMGKLASDVGIAVSMGYNNLNANREPTGSSGAYAFSIPNALMKAFGYGNAVYCPLGDEVASATASSAAKIYQRAFYSNLDAGVPVLVGITGHQVVGDGYGYVDGSDYIHLNMGWQGQFDFWYRFPDVKYSSLGGDMTFKDVNYNVFTNANATCATLSGRVVDADGNPVAGLGVKVFASDTKELEAEAVTSATGVWGVILPAGRYDVSVQKAGYTAKDALGITLAAPTIKNVELRGAASWRDSAGKQVALVTETAPTVKSSDGIGNVWGITQTLTPANAVVRSGSDRIASCATLDEAITEAQGVSDARIEIWRPVPLKGLVTNEVDCLIVATNALPAESAITCADGAKLVVADGAKLTLSNVVMTAASGAAIEVVDGGRLRLGARVEVSAIITETADGLEVYAPLETSGLSVDCRAAVKDGDTFGVISGSDFLAISNTITRLLKSDDEDVYGLAVETGRKIVWARQSCDPAVAEAGVVTGGVTNYCRRLERALTDYLDTADEIVVLRTSAISEPHALGRNFKISVAKDVSIVAGEKAGFTVTNGSLTVAGATFGDYQGAGLFIAKGGVVNLENCVFTNIESSALYSGVLQVLAGSARVNRCLFDNCRIPDTVSSGYGAGIYVKGGASLAFLSSVIRNGYAKTYGGGIYADKSSSVTIGGFGTVVMGNSSGNYRIDNLLAANANVALTVSDEMSGEQCVGVRFSGKNTSGSQFAVFAAPPTTEEAAHDAAAFTSDANDALVAMATETGLAWTNEPPEDHTVEDPTDAVAAVTLPGEAGEKYYPTIEYAFEAVLKDGASIRLLADCTLARAVTVSNDLSLASTPGDIFTIARTEGISLTVSEEGALHLSNVEFTNAGMLVAEESCPLVEVTGGSLELNDGTTISYVLGTDSRIESAVYVLGGTLRMNAGATISNGANSLVRPADGAGYGGALAADESTLELFGGTITSSTTYRFGGGVFAGNRSTVRISGDMTIDGNWTVEGESSNLTVSDNSTLELVGALTGSIGIYPGEAVDDVVFGEVTGALTEAALTNSAYRFSNDVTGAYGVPARRADGTSDETLLVWSKAFDEDGYVTVETEAGSIVYKCVGDIPVDDVEITVYPTPIAFRELRRESAACSVTFTNLVRGCWYSLYATNSLAGGFAIDATLAPVTNFQAETDGPFTFTYPTDASALYWRATATEGKINP